MMLIVLLTNYKAVTRNLLGEGFPVPSAHFFPCSPVFPLRLEVARQIHIRHFGERW